MSNNPVLKLDAQSFTDEVLQSDRPVLVDFWADWCPPCRAIAPTIDALASEFEERVKVAKVDVDANSALAETYEVRSIPTLILFRNGVESERIVGVSNRRTLSDKLSEALLAA